MAGLGIVPPVSGTEPPFDPMSTLDDKQNLLEEAKAQSTDGTGETKRAARRHEGQEFWEFPDAETWWNMWLLSTDI